MSREDVFYNQQRMALKLLADTTSVGQTQFKLDPKSITAPASLIQELPLTNATNKLEFQFGINAPQPTQVLNNFVLGQNDIAVVYGFQLLIGQGALIVNRTYRTFGPAPQDNAPYNSQMTLQLESNVAVTQLDTLAMRKDHGTDRDQYDGCIVINPMRIISGKVSNFLCTITMPNVNATVFTPNLFVSLRPLIALGQATF